MYIKLLKSAARFFASHYDFPDAESVNEVEIDTLKNSAKIKYKSEQGTDWAEIVVLKGNDCLIVSDVAYYPDKDSVGNT